MKLFIVVAVVMITTVSCKDRAKVAQLESSRDSLQAQLDSLSIELTDNFALISDIENNIDEIKEREQMISLDQENRPDDKASKKQLVEDLEAINKLMAENKDKIIELNKKLEGSNYQTGKFKKMVANLEDKVANQETEINHLNMQINELTAKNDDLNTQVDSLFNINTNNSETISQNEATIEQLGDELHTAYYIAGPAEELVNKQIISKEGGFIGLGKVDRLNPKLNLNELTMVDTRNVNTFPIDSKKMELVTEHPQDSYKIVVSEGDDKVDQLVILDPGKFWASSKVLVMVTR